MYAHAKRSGRCLFLAGKGAGVCRGKVGRDVTVEQAQEFARTTALMLLAVIVQELGSLDRVSQILKVTGYVNSVPDFEDHPKVMNGCSALLLDVFGQDGSHVRTSIGVASTPDQIPVEIDMIIEFHDENA
jgi:enamine deaminase RidA (YjgF/YER057c/UK114 family)